MSDYGKIDGRALDRHITGNYGEDQFREGPGYDPCPDCGAGPRDPHARGCPAEMADEEAIEVVPPQDAPEGGKVFFSPGEWTDAGKRAALEAELAKLPLQPPSVLAALRAERKTKEETVDALLANPVYLPESGLVRRLRARLLTLPAAFLEDLLLVLGLKEG